MQGIFLRFQSNFRKYDIIDTFTHQLNMWHRQTAIYRMQGQQSERSYASHFLNQMKGRLQMGILLDYFLTIKEDHKSFKIPSCACAPTAPTGNFFINVLSSAFMFIHYHCTTPFHGFRLQILSIKAQFESTLDSHYHCFMVLGHRSYLSKNSLNLLQTPN